MPKCTRLSSAARSKQCLFYEFSAHFLLLLCVSSCAAVRFMNRMSVFGDERNKHHKSTKRLTVRRRHAEIGERPMPLYGNEWNSAPSYRTGDGEMTELFWVEIGLFWFFVCRSNDSRQMQMLECRGIVYANGHSFLSTFHVKMRVSSWNLPKISETKWVAGSLSISLCLLVEAKMHIVVCIFYFPTTQ